MLIGGAAGVPSRLAVGTNGYVLTMVSGAPTWSASSGGGFANPMTAVGDLIVGGTAGAPTTYAAGASGLVLTSNGAGVAPTWQAAAGGGSLTGFASALNTASPNATVNVSNFTVSGGTTDNDVALVPKAGGAKLGAIPDSTTAGGNKRGTFAVDWQTGTRSSAAQVASGSYSTISGGRNNTASAAGAIVPGGDGNTASATNAVALGSTNTSDGSSSIVVGNQGKARGESGVLVLSTSPGGVGLDQKATRVQRIRTTTATATRMSSAGVTPAAGNSVILPAFAAYAYRITVMGVKFGTTDASAWIFEGLIYMNNTTLTLAGTPVVRPIGVTAGASTWTATIQLNSTLKSIEVEVTGAAGTTIDWSADFVTLEQNH
jgi:hypothetical protein